MRKRRSPRLIFPCATLLTACAGPLVIDAPPPQLLEDTGSVGISVPASTIEAPIHYDLSPILDMLEETVPPRFGDLDERKKHPTNGRVSYAFSGSRSPFRVSMDGTTIRLGSTVTYEAKGWFDPPIGPTISGGCDGREQKPRISLAVRSTFSIDSMWRLRARSRLTRAVPLSELERDRCTVTFLNIDMTDNVVGGATRGLQRKLNQIDRRIASIDVHDHVQGWWKAMARPISLGSDSLWLTLNPFAVALDTVQSDSTRIIATVSLSYRPLITTGPRPFDADAPLPPLRRGTATGSALHAVLVGLARYPDLSAELTRRLAGKKLRIADRRIAIKALTLRGIGGSRVALALDFTGAAEGRIWLTGTPVYDATREVLSVPDLDYDVGSAKVLVKGAELLIGFEARDLLRNQAHFSVDDLSEQARAIAEKAMNRQLTEGVNLVAKLTKGSALLVRADTTAVRVYFEAQGDAGLVINRAPDLQGMIRK